MNTCKPWKLLAWMFFGLVMGEALYSGVKFGCWLGFIAGITGFLGGLLYGRFRKKACKAS